MKVLVTGATGFLGSHLVASLLARGDLVVAVCREAEPELAAAATTAAPAVVDPPVSRTSAGCPLTMFSLAIWKKPSPLLVIAHCSAVDSMPLSAAVVSGIPAEPALPFVSRTCPLTALTSL